MGESGDEKHIMPRSKTATAGTAKTAYTHNFFGLCR
jgi:hypothetical protein